MTKDKRKTNNEELEKLNEEIKELEEKMLPPRKGGPPKPKRIEDVEEYFMANGHKYYFEFELTIERYRKYEELQYLVAYGVNLEQIVKDDMAIDKALTGADIFGGIHEAKTILLNRRISAGRQLADREHEVLLFCSLFIVREDEDLTKWTLAQAKEKIEDWTKEGISIYSFFLLAPKLIKGLNELQRLSLQADPSGNESHLFGLSPDGSQ